MDEIELQVLLDYKENQLDLYVNNLLNKGINNQDAEIISKIIQKEELQEDILVSKNSRNLPKELRDLIDYGELYDDQENQKKLYEKIKGFGKINCNVRSFISASSDLGKNTDILTFGKIRSEINVPKGTNAIGMDIGSKYLNEKEILFDKGHTLEYYGCRYDKKRDAVVLKFNMIE